MRNFIKYWLPVVLVAALIFAVSSIPRLPPVPVEIPHLDKGVHLVEYTLLSFLLKRALSQRKNRVRKSSLKVVVWTILYGIANELHQSLIPDRHMSGFDILFKSLGAVLGQSLYSLYFRYSRN
ncbi:VanZ family protein [candidate division NPL-UPA2 bacterium]|nr:VanZ family protein [candidate division NPL-UPA2 bacterium]